MKQNLFIAMLVAALPATAVAQATPLLDPPEWGPRIRATPFVGFGAAFRSQGSLSVITGDQLFSDSYDFEYGSGPVTGVNLEVRAHRRFSALASVAWSRRGETRFETIDGIATDVGSDFWMARVAPAIRLREREAELQFRNLSALLFAGPAVIREQPELNLRSAPEWRDPVTHWGVNFGAEAELPLANDRLAFTAALEDYLIFWDAEAVERHLRRSYQAKHGAGAVAEADPNLSNLVVLRIGLTFRFGN